MGEPLTLIGSDDDRTIAAELGALPCPCCGTPPFINAMCSRPMVEDDDENAGIGMAVMCSNDDCRLSTMTSFGQENWMTAVQRWNRRTTTQGAHTRC